MREYNGFSSAQRAKAGVYRKRMIREGRIPNTPPDCKACGQTQGSMCYHTEDYTEPHGPWTVAFEICYVCHMMIHCRHRSADNWQTYIDALMTGSTFPPIFGYNFKYFASKYLRPGWLPEPCSVDGPKRKLLIEIHHGVYNPHKNPHNKGWAPAHIIEACTGELSHG